MSTSKNVFISLLESSDNSLEKIESRRLDLNKQIVMEQENAKNVFLEFAKKLTDAFPCVFRVKLSRNSTKQFDNSGNVFLALSHEFSFYDDREESLDVSVFSDQTNDEEDISHRIDDFLEDNGWLLFSPDIVFGELDFSKKECLH